MVTPELLRRFAHFSRISEDGLRQLAEIAEESVVPSGQRLFTEFDPADRLYLILEGEVTLQYEMGSGELRTVDTLVEGELLVWSALVEPYRCTAIGVAARETRLVGFDAVKLRDLCEGNHKLGQQLLTQVAKLLADRLASARSQLAAV